MKKAERRPKPKPRRVVLGVGCAHFDFAWTGVELLSKGDYVELRGGSTLEDKRIRLVAEVLK